MITLPPNACDCHVHVIGPAERYPFVPTRVYTPGDALEASLEALHARLGIARVVVVHPSVYGTDNSRTLDGLKRLGARARGIAVIDNDTTNAELDQMHRAGVRGVRVNIATAGMNDPEEALRQIRWNAARVSHLGWHVQVLTKLEVIDALGSALTKLPTPLVVDHFGLLVPTLGLEQPGFEMLCKLVATGRVNVKLSAIERLTGAGRGMVMLPFIRALAEANIKALVWGSDWPHTGGGRGQRRAPTDIEPFQPLNDANALTVLAHAIPDAGARADILVHTPARLYDFA
jgi:predicted TIM-barrel fold metal-dependent hydrolase